VERRLGAATRGYVLIGEGVSGDVGELRELQGGEREVRKGSMGGKKGSKGALTKKGQTAVALGQNPTWRRGLRWREPVWRTCGRWRSGRGA
jgi:hypothetical protein